MVGIVTLITYLIGLGGFHDIIAGSNKMFFLVASEAESCSWFLTSFILSTLVGNIIGGVSLVAFLGHAQVLPVRNPSSSLQSPHA